MALVAVAAVVGAILRRFTELVSPTASVSGPSCEAEVAPVLSRLRGSLPGGPRAPDSAELLSAKEYPGDCESDGPGIE